MITLTIEEIGEGLIERCDADFLVELLDISSEEVVERFKDKLEIKYDTLIEFIGDDENDYTLDESETIAGEA